GSESSGLNISNSGQNTRNYAVNSTEQTKSLQPPKATPECIDDEEEFSEKPVSQNTATAEATRTTETSSHSGEQKSVS
ncbi:unnamed protein product, partial [Trichobilharzia regenti]